jgi:flavin-dependent dehydrogenase
MNARQCDCDVAVIGGGPAGSTAAAILARHGRRVVLFEKERFPRYHIGESLLPFCYFTLDRLGMVSKLNAAGFVKKYSVQFASRDGRISTPFYFDQHLDSHPASQTWQVERADFDRLLLENARDSGAQVCMNHQVRDLIAENGRTVGVRVADEPGAPREVRAAVTIDATGRDALAITKNQWRVRDPYLNKVAVWTYFEGAVRDPGRDEGATTVAYLADNGWFWYIPLRNDRVSVGLVAEREYVYRDTRDPAAIVAREIQNNEWVRSHLAPARQTGEYRVTGEFSYRSKHCAADGLVLTGDALAFLDPVFSSGVFLALVGGERCADAVHAALEAGDTSAARFAPYGEDLIRDIESMRKLVYAFYDPRFNFRAMFTKYPEMKSLATDCLIGNLSRDFGPLFAAMAEFANLPEPLAHGRAQGSPA